MIIDLSQTQVWDLTGVDALDRVVFKYRRQGAQVEVVGLNPAAQALVERLGQYDKRDLPA